jgi:hypothetical protein
MAPTLDQRTDRESAADSKLFELIDAGGLVRLTQVEAHQDCTVTALRAFKHTAQMGAGNAK